ncbi:MAG: hypothetical protein HUU35_11490 [Armatimonadetes bacterium]|nr:hypothetical protein [Armatimonadota bacterium]
MRRVVLLALLTTPTLAAEMLTNGGFEPPYQTVNTVNAKASITGALAEGWSDNSSWAEVGVVYGEQRQAPHGGTSCQRIDVREVRSGGVQLTQPAQLLTDHSYAASLWIRGETPVMVRFQLRLGPAPYTSFAGKEVLAGPEWQRVDLFARLRQPAQALLMILPAAPGVIEVDDASLADVTEAVSDAPPLRGNLLPNGSFEAGLGAGWSVRVRGAALPWVAARSEFADPRAVVAAGGADGQQALQVTIPPQMAALIASPRVAYRYGHPYTASVALKSDREVAVELELEGGPKANVRVGNRWQRHEVSGLMPYGHQTRLWLRCWSDNVTLQADAAQLTEGATPTGYQPAWPLELALRVPRPGSVFFEAEPAEVEVRTAGALPRGATLYSTLTELNGEECDLPAVPLPASSFTIPPLVARPQGMFRVLSQVFAGDQPLSPAVSVVFARLPRPRELDPEKSYFGVHIPLAPEYFAIARAIGARWTRIHDASGITKWPMAEPERDQFQFFDEPVDAARAAGLRILGMLDGAPPWASVKPKATTGYFAVYNHPDAPDAMARWENYVARVVEHYRGRIDHWEVWNEPWGDSFAPGSPEVYGELLRRAAPVARAANPQAVILGIDTYRGRPAFTNTALATAGLESFDIFSYHDYNNSLYGGPVDQARQQVEQFTADQAKLGQPRPIWSSEGGPGEIGSFYGWTGDGLAPRLQGAQVVRFDVCAMSAGVQKFFYYTLHADPASEVAAFCGLEHDRAIRPAMAARAVLASLVDGATPFGRSEPAEGLEAFAFRQTDGSMVSVVWSMDGRPHPLTVPAESRALSLMGNPLAGPTVSVTMEPIYLLQP